MGWAFASKEPEPEPDELPEEWTDWDDPPGPPWPPGLPIDSEGDDATHPEGFLLFVSIAEDEIIVESEDAYGVEVTSEAFTLEIEPTEVLDGRGLMFTFDLVDEDTGESVEDVLCKRRDAEAGDWQPAAFGVVRGDSLTLELDVLLSPEDGGLLLRVRVEAFEFDPVVWGADTVPVYAQEPVPDDPVIVLLDTASVADPPVNHHYMSLQASEGHYFAVTSALMAAQYDMGPTFGELVRQVSGEDVEVNALAYCPTRDRLYMVGPGPVQSSDPDYDHRKVRIGRLNPNTGAFDWENSGLLNPTFEFHHPHVVEVSCGPEYGYGACSDGRDPHLFRFDYDDLSVDESVEYPPEHLSFQRVEGAVQSSPTVYATGAKVLVMTAKYILDYTPWLALNGYIVPSDMPEITSNKGGIVANPDSFYHLVNPSGDNDQIYRRSIVDLSTQFTALPASEAGTARELHLWGDTLVVLTETHWVLLDAVDLSVILAQEHETDVTAPVAAFDMSALDKMVVALDDDGTKQIRRYAIQEEE